MSARGALELAEMIGNHVAAEYDDDPALDDMILRLRAATLPRTVSTLAELDALPESAVVWSEFECIAYQKYGGITWGGASRDWDSQQITLPATVLYTPNPEGDTA